MTLLVDAGNTRFKWARSASPSAVCVGEYGQAGKAESLIAWLQDEAGEDVLLCSVLGDAFRAAVSGWANDRFAHTLTFLQTERSACGVEIAYEQPENLGTDRFVALVGAHHRYSGDCVVVDCGTAITLDAISAAGQHAGGLIIPGIALMRESLGRRTKEIGSRDGDPTHLFARDTPDAVYSGTLRAVAAAVDRISREMADALGGEASLVICGGDAELLSGMLEGHWQVDPYLVIRGLAVLAQ